MRSAMDLGSPDVSHAARNHRYPNRPGESRANSYPVYRRNVESQHEYLDITDQYTLHLMKLSARSPCDGNEENCSGRRASRRQVQKTIEPAPSSFEVPGPIVFPPSLFVSCSGLGTAAFFTVGHSWDTISFHDALLSFEKMSPSSGCKLFTRIERCQGHVRLCP